jgi:hypothetical protein
MPYKGSTNAAVAHDIKEGFRLPPPNACPMVVYAVMADCWLANCEERLSFRRAYRRLVAAWDECAPSGERAYEAAFTSEAQVTFDDVDGGDSGSDDAEDEGATYDMGTQPGWFWCWCAFG